MPLNEEEAVLIKAFTADESNEQAILEAAEQAGEERKHLTPEALETRLKKDEQALHEQLASYSTAGDTEKASKKQALISAIADFSATQAALGAAQAKKELAAEKSQEPQKPNPDASSAARDASAKAAALAEAKKELDKIEKWADSIGVVGAPF